MSLTLAGLAFDNTSYDADADVLYLHVGDPGTAVEWRDTDEGDSLRYDGDGGLVGITILSPRVQGSRLQTNAAGRRTRLLRGTRELPQLVDFDRTGAGATCKCPGCTNRGERESGRWRSGRGWRIARSYRGPGRKPADGEARYGAGAVEVRAAATPPRPPRPI